MFRTIKGRRYDLSNQSDFDRLIKRLNAAYFDVDQEPLVLDPEYDDLLQQYQDTFHVSFKESSSITTNSNKKNEVTLPYFMPSISKKNKEEEFQHWLNGIKLINIGNHDDKTLHFFVSDKVDGISCLINYYPDSKTSTYSYPIQLTSRGSSKSTDGQVGKDISHIVPYLTDILPNHTVVKSFKRPIRAVRCEVVLSEERFEVFKTMHPEETYTCARNAAQGILARKKTREEDVKLLQFIVFKVFYQDDLILPFETHISDLDELGFQTPHFSRLAIRCTQNEDKKQTKRAHTQLCWFENQFQCNDDDNDDDKVIEANGFSLNTSSSSSSSKKRNRDDHHTEWTSRKEMKHSESEDNTEIETIEQSDAFQWIENEITKRKELAGYEMDGLVISLVRNMCDHVVGPDDQLELPFAEVAIKITGETAIVTVKTVEWAISKGGKIAPTIIFEKSVFLDGGNLGKAYAGSGQIIRKNQIGPGAEILIRRSGATIPAFRQLIKPSPTGPMLPPTDTYSWEWNEKQADIFLVKAEKANGMMNQDMRLRKLITFFNVMETENISDGRVEMLAVEFGFDLRRILEEGVDRQTLLSIPKVQTKLAKIIADALLACRRKPISVVTAIAASSIIDNHFGVKRISWILDAHPTIFHWKDFDAKKEEYIEKLCEIDGISSKLATTFLECMPQIIEWLAIFTPLLNITHMVRLPREEKEEQEEEEEKNEESTDQQQQSTTTSINPMSIIRKRIFVFTEYRNKLLEAFLLKHGATEIANRITKKESARTILIVAKRGQGTGKEKEAEKYNVPIYTPDQFMRLIGFPS